MNINIYIQREMESVAVWQSQSHEPAPFLVMEISTPMVYQLPIKVGWQRR